MKNEPKVYKGAANTKPGVTLIMADETFQALAEGKVSSTMTNPTFPIF